MIHMMKRLKLLEPIIQCFLEEKIQLQLKTEKLLKVQDDLCNHVLWEKREADLGKIYRKSNEALLEIVKDEIDKCRRVVIGLEEKVIKRTDDYKMGAKF
jgi:hypothetical protein